MMEHPNNNVISEDMVDRVALAMAQEIGWGTFSHFNPDDMRRVAKAALEAVFGTAKIGGSQ